MADFKSAFAKGQTAAADAARARAEIGTVVRELSDQLFEASEETIRIKEGEVADESLLPNLALVNPLFRKTHHAIVALNPTAESSSAVELAGFNISPTGYPVTVKWDEELFECLDRADLEHALETLLADVRTGQKLSRLRTLPPTRKPT